LDVLKQKNIAEIIQTGETWRLNDLFAIHEMINRGIAIEAALLAKRKQELKESASLTNLLSTSFAIIATAIIVIYFFTNLFNIRERRWLQGFLESVLNTSQNGIIYYRAIRNKGKIVDFKVEFVNQSIEPLLDIKTQSVIGKKLKDLPPFLRTSNLIERYVQVVETAQSLAFETMYSGNNIQKWFVISIVKLKDGLTASFQDITQLKKYEGELKNNIVLLERSNNELEQYAYVASHDLQEPLRKIRSFGSFLMQTQADRLDEKGKEHLQKIMTSAERMSVLITDILSFSSVKRQEDFVVTDLNKVWQDVLADFELTIAQKEPLIEAEPLPVIEAIPLQMNQLFYNLLNNSLKFSKEDEKPVIKITSGVVDEEKRTALHLPAGVVYYEIVFTDNGIGFSQEYAELIFGLFKRLNDKHYYPGSGIGLALCKKVVNNHRGIIIAKGAENEGASFFIYLPEQQLDLFH